MLPPHPDDSPAAPTHEQLIHGDLRAVTARVLAEQARVAFDQADATLFEGALAALVELVASPEPGRRRS